MSAPLTLGARPAGAPAGRSRRRIVDLAAPLFVVGYIVVTFAPFELLIGPLLSMPTSALCVAGIMILVITPSDRLARIPISLPLTGFLTWAALSLLWTDAVGFTLYLVRTEVLLIAVLMLVAGTIETRVLVRWLMATSIAICVWSFAISFVLPAARSVEGADGVSLAFRGTFIHKNVLGVFAVLTLAGVLSLVRGRWRTPSIVLLVVTALATRSATAGSGLLALTFVWLWILAINRGRTRRDRRLLLAISITSAIAAVLTAFRLVPLLLTLYDKEPTFSGRTIIWSESLDVARLQPVTGFGFGGIFSETPTPRTLKLWSHIGFEAAHAHSGAIETLLELGAVGVTLIFLFYFSVIRLSAVLGRTPSQRDLSRWGTLFVIPLLVMALAEPLLAGPYLGITVIVWSALAGAVPDRRARRSARGQRASRRRRRPVTPIDEVSSIP